MVEFGSPHQIRTGVSGSRGPHTWPVYTRGLRSSSFFLSYYNFPQLETRVYRTLDHRIGFHCYQNDHPRFLIHQSSKIWLTTTIHSMMRSKIIANLDGPPSFEAINGKWSGFVRRTLQGVIERTDIAVVAEVHVYGWIDFHCQSMVVVKRL